MFLRSFYRLSTLLLCFHPIFRPHALVAADTAGTLQFYNDWNCEHPSTLNPTVTLQLSTCLVTTGAEGVVIDTVPPCPQGTAAPIYYADTACGVQVDVTESIFSKGCFELAAGVNLFNSKSLMFSCQPAANNPHPSSTTTAVISALAAVATGSTGSNGGGGGSGSSTSSAGGSSSTGTNSQKNGTGNTGSSNEGTSGTSSTSDSGLNTGDIIALAVGLGIGIPTIVIMILAWKYPRVRDTVTRLILGWDPQQRPFPHSQSQQRLHGEPTELAFQPNKPPQQQPYNHPYELPSQRTGPQQWQYNRPQEMDSHQQPFRYS